MLEKNPEEINIQRNYYAQTAANYDAMRSEEEMAIGLSLSFMLGALDKLDVSSILDIGSGSGRALGVIKNKRPDIHSIGIEPVCEMREIGYASGIPEDELIDGDATKLEFEDGAFDMVCEFATLHHIRNPEMAVAEMLRVAKKAIFICDSNNFGQGSVLSRAIKQAANTIGLWPMVDFIKTKGKGYTISKGDGLGYSYSVFNNYDQIRKQCRSIHIMNASDAGINLYRSSPDITLLGIK